MLIIMLPKTAKNSKHNQKEAKENILIANFSNSERFWEKASKFTITKLKDCAIFRFVNKLCRLANLGMRVPKLTTNFLQILINFKKKFRDRTWMRLSYEQISEYIGCSLPTVASIIKACEFLRLIKINTSKLIHEYLLDYFNLQALISDPVAYFNNILTLEALSDNSDNSDNAVITRLDNAVITEITVPSEIEKLIAKNGDSEITYRLIPPPVLRSLGESSEPADESVEAEETTHIYSTDIPTTSNDFEFKILSDEPPESLAGKALEPASKYLNKILINYIVCKCFFKLVEEENKKAETAKEEALKSPQEKLVPVCVALTDQRVSINTGEDRCLQTPSEPIDSAFIARRGAAEQNIQSSASVSKPVLVRQEIKDAIAAFERGYLEFWDLMEGQNNHAIALPKPVQLNRYCKALLNKYSIERVYECLVYTFSYLEQGRQKVKNIAGFLVECVRQWDEWKKHIYEYEMFKEYEHLVLEDWGILSP